MAHVYNDIYIKMVKLGIQDVKQIYAVCKRLSEEFGITLTESTRLMEITADVHALVRG